MTSVVVVGSGVAGLTAAISAAERGLRVTVVTKRELACGSTRYAQGGIAGAVFAGDTAEAHAADTLRAGARLGDPEAVRVLCEEGPDRIRELIARGARFDRDASGEYVRGLEAAHGRARILHAGGDATGAEIERALIARVRETAVEVVEHAFVEALVADGGRVAGVDVLIGGPAGAGAGADGEVDSGACLDRVVRSNLSDACAAGDADDAGVLVAPDPAAVARRGRQAEAEANRASALLGDPDSATEARPARAGAEAEAAAGRAAGLVARRILADAVILATGGAGRLFDVTSNPEVATGDGVALALRAGAAVVDLELVQFHPTLAALGRPFLVSEAVRGEGAILRGLGGRRFMLDAHPDAELAPRDVVARAIARELRAIDEAGADETVTLDATMHPRELLERRFPTITRELDARGLDWSRQPVPVAPGAHFAMGGVAVDLHARTTLPGLYAVGEVARSGVHGANRLASNSLLEGLVFAERAVDAIAAGEDARAWPALGAWAQPSPGGGAPSTPGVDRETRPAPGPAAEAFSREALQRLMSAAAGVERDGQEMRAALATVRDWRAAHRARLFAGPVPDRAEPLLPERPKGGVAPAPFPTARVRDLEDANLLDLAVATLECALARTASIGAHWRRDAAEREGAGEERGGSARRLVRAGGRSGAEAPFVAARPRVVAALARTSTPAPAPAASSASAARPAASIPIDQEIAC